MALNMEESGDALSQENCLKTCLSLEHAALHYPFPVSFFSLPLIFPRLSLDCTPQKRTAGLQPIESKSRDI